MVPDSAMTQQSELLDIAQAAAFLHVSQMSLRRWTNSGRLPCFRVGGRRERRFRRADLLAFLERSGEPIRAPQGPGHLCGLYTSMAARERWAAAFLAAGLEAGAISFLAAEAAGRPRLFGPLPRGLAPGPAAPPGGGPVPLHDAPPPAAPAREWGGGGYQPTSRRAA